MNITPDIADSKERVLTLGFTKDQLNAYNNLIAWINSPFESGSAKRALVGPAGTGKTYLVKALIKNCKMSYSTIGLAAPTHKACRVLTESIGLSNVKVNTIQSDLGFRLNFDMAKFDIKNPPFNPASKPKIGNYKLYIVDESSMLNRGLCSYLEKICKEKEIKIIYIGDASQLAPVGEKYSPALKGIVTYTLTEIVRQEEDNPIRPLLDLLRFDIKNKTFRFLNYIHQNRSKFDEGNTKGYRVCTPDEFNKLVSMNFNDPELTKDVDYCKIIGYTNACVGAWNKYIRKSIILDAEKSVITKNDLIIAYITIVNRFNDVVIANSEEYILKDVVNYTHPNYALKGFLVRFIAIHGGKVTTPLFVLDHNDVNTIKNYVTISKHLIDNAKNASVKLRAARWKEYYAFKEECLLLTNIGNEHGAIIFSRDLDYGFALTSHKSQGSTFNTAFVDVDDIVFDKHGNLYTDVEEINRRLYVACSRCKEKLYLKFTR